MRDYSKISNTLWRSRKFRLIRTDDQARLLYFYLHTCPQVNSVGCFSIPLGYICADTGWNEKASTKAMESLGKAGLIEWDGAEELVRIVDFIPHDPPTNPRHAEGMAKIAMGLPDTPMKSSVIKDLLAQKQGQDKHDMEAEMERLCKASTKPTETPLPYPAPAPKEESSLRSDLSAETDPIDAAFDAYNAMVQRLPIDANGKPPIPLCRKRTTARRRSMSARLKDCGGLTGWGYALDRLANTPGLLGGHGGDGHENWTADIDFLLSEQKFTRLMEGKYDNWGRGAPKNGAGPTMDDLRRAAAEADRREQEGVI